ncbi:MAG TPA: zinc ribbon domain-containing protein [Candidatus Bathyarchaeia archaeon]|nr:zinc ribbon domain-containing protein [Candidatus Bathyarchaeia archaeon]
MQCPNPECGATVDDGAHVCPHCGTALTAKRSERRGIEDPTPAALVGRARKLATASLILGIVACALPWAGSAALNALGFQAEWRPPFVGTLLPVSYLLFAGATIASLVIALAAIVAGHLAIARGGGTRRSLIGALVIYPAGALIILFCPLLVGLHIPQGILFIGMLAFPSLFVALAAFVFVHIAVTRFRRVPQTGGATWRPVLGTLLGYLNIALIALLALAFFGKGRHNSDSAICGNSLKQIGRVLQVEYVNEIEGQFYPPLSSQPGVLMFAADEVPQKDVIGPLLTCPTIRYADQPTTGPASPFDDQSYFYLGYAVLNDDDVEAFAQAYRERLAEIEKPEGRVFHEDLVVQIGGRTRVLHRLREGVERVLISEDAAPSNDVAAAARIQNEIPVLIERDLGGHIEYLGNPATPIRVAKVLYMSGDVRFVPSGKWPVTEKTQRILAELAKSPPQ